jgi:hypothetical protein
LQWSGTKQGKGGKTKNKGQRLTRGSAGVWKQFETEVNAKLEASHLAAKRLVPFAMDKKNFTADVQSMTLKIDGNRAGYTRCDRRLLEPFNTKNPSFYQDRLGTNIGESTQKKGVLRRKIRRNAPAPSGKANETRLFAMPFIYQKTII